MDEQAMEKHVYFTYISLRYGVAAIGALLPVGVYLLGKLKGVGLQDSISAYYWAAPTDGAAPSRDFFVGSLFAVAALLYLYKGFSKAENYLLNAAGVLLVGVALFPMEQSGASGGKFSIHGFCAVSAFAGLAFVVWFLAQKTLPLLPPEAKPERRWFRMAYIVVGFFMLASPVTAFVLISVLRTDTAFIFFVEAAGIWAFAAYWLIKSFELGKSAATKLALEGKVTTTATKELKPLASAAASRLQPQ